VKSAPLLTVLALALAGGAWCWFTLGERDATSEPAAAPGVSAPGVSAPVAQPAAEAPGRERALSEVASALDAGDSRRTAQLPRTERPRPLEPSSGALEVEVVWASRSGGAARVPLSVFALDSSQPHVPRLELEVLDDGRARCGSLPPGRVRVASGLGAQVETVVVSGQTSTARLVLDDGYALKGRTVNAAGRTVANATLWILRPGSRDSLRVGESDASGNFRLLGATAGQRLFARSLENSPSVPVTLEGPLSERFELRLSLGMAAATVSGQILDVDETPLGGAAVALEPIALVGGEPPPRALGITDAEGRFHLVGCETGAARLLVLHEDCVPLERPVTALPDQRNELIVRLTPGTLVAGTVYTADGKPAADVPLRQSSTHAWLARETRSDAQGRYVLRGVPPGTASITVGSATQVVEIPRNSAFTWNPRLRAPSGD